MALAGLRARSAVFPGSDLGADCTLLSSLCARSHLPVWRLLVIVVNPTIPRLIGPMAAFVRVHGRCALQHFLVEVDYIAFLVGVVFERIPGKRMVLFTNAEESAERHESVSDLARVFVQHDFIDAAEFFTRRIVD